MSMAFGLAGRIAVATGGSGLGMAQGIVTAECAVAVRGFRADENAGAVRRLCECGSVAERASAEATFAATPVRFGRVDGMFANAGTNSQGKGDFISRPLSDWRTVFATDVEGMVICFRLAAAHMVKRNRRECVRLPRRYIQNRDESHPSGLEHC